MGVLSPELQVKQEFYTARPITVFAPMYEAFARGKMVPTQQCSAISNCGSMDEVALAFAQQPYDHHPAISKDRSIIIVEDPQFFQSSEGLMKFHKLKLVMHQTTMQAYRDRLVHTMRSTLQLTKTSSPPCSRKMCLGSIHETVRRALKNEIKPWQRKRWVIPPNQNGSFVSSMEMILDVYKRPFDIIL